MKKYDHKSIERKWQTVWKKKKLHSTPDKKKGAENYHLLVEFPYPSGNLHVGHWYAFAIPDILARTLRMQGKNVLYPIGFDAFGLPAENAAIQRKLDPRKWTYDNIAHMRKQIASMGASFDLSREVITADPEYYKWTQWQFLQFFKKGLAYRKDTFVNWCPKDKTVLANEQVVEGKCDRCGSDVVQKKMLQWNLRITDYADRLVDDLTPLNWPEEIKESQRNWIGRSEGAEISFPLEFEKNDGSKPNYLILHGYKSSSKGAFIPWLQRELEGRGYKVQVPDLPNSDAPKEAEQVKKVLDSCPVDEDTIIVGHSLGGGIALRVLETINKPIAGLVLVGSVVNVNFPGAQPRPFAQHFNWDFDYDSIKKLFKFCVVLSDLQEGNPRVPYLKFLAAKLGARLIEGNAKKEHFRNPEEPMVLNALLPHIPVFTTRADTLFGGTYLVLAPEHPWVTLALEQKTVLANNDEVAAYVAGAKKKTELERQENRDKSGVELKGVMAINPASGTKMPLWVADFVIGSYGTGAVFADAHDERDYEFAKKFGIPLKETLEPLVVRTSGLDSVHADEPFTDRPAVLAIVQHWAEDKYLAVRYRPTDTRGCVSGGIEAGETPEQAAIREIAEETGYTSAELVRKLGGSIHCKYYSVIRKLNVFAHFTPLLLKLKDATMVEVSEKEKAHHEISWLTKAEMDNFINREDMKVAWSRTPGDVCYSGKGILFDSAEFSGLTSEEAIPRVGDKYGTRVKQYRLRDWVVSRQRYWGVPIPIIHCPKCGEVAVPDKDLPVKLPAVKDFLPDGNGKSPLAKVTKFVKVKCPQCKGAAERETDTLDTFVDSSWYFLRYTDPKNKKEFASRKKQDNWMPVNFYSGGPEHTTMHVLYSRFWHKALFDLGLVKDAEPYTRRMSHGLILGPDSQKMSKSHGNVIDPDAIVERLGADTVRLYLAFIGPYSEAGSYPWNPDGVVGVRRFLERVWRAQELVTKNDVAALESALHKAVKKVGDDNALLKFNTAISALMILLNAIEKEKTVGKGQWQIFLRLLAPFAPHIADELWMLSGKKTSIHLEKWPQYEAAKLLEETATIVVQINGKTRAQVSIPAGADKTAQESAAKGAIADRLAGKNIIRSIVVPGRLVNFVVSE